jgi:lipopolysaccharide export system protein LptA
MTGASVFITALVLLCAALLGAAPAGAQDQSAATGSSGGSGFALGGGSQPVEISADNGIEWDRDGKTYTAHGNAVASQGNSEIHASTLIASYSGNSNDIDHVVAEGAVKIINPSQTVYGDHADYNRTRQLMVVTGNALKIEGNAQTVTARDAFEYWQGQDAMVAKGAVVIVKADGTIIHSDLATSYFHKNAATGKREVFQVKAEGHVRIDTAKEVVTCEHAVYDPATQIAVLTGNVVLTQGRSEFRGARAELDMKKGISRLMPAPGQRVHTTIQPKQNASPSATPQGSGLQSGTSSGQIALGGTASTLAAGSQ